MVASIKSSNNAGASGVSSEHHEAPPGIQKYGWLWVSQEDQKDDEPETGVWWDVLRATKSCSPHPQLQFRRGLLERAARAL